MDNIRIIPSLLLYEDRLVKGVKFINHIDSGDPIKTCVAYDSQIADEIILIDLKAYKNNLTPNYSLLKKICSEANTPITFGGNIKNEDEAIKSIYYGADKIIINNNLDNTNLIKNLSRKIGNQAIVAGLDIFKDNGEYKLYKRGKILNYNPLKKVEEILSLDIGELKITFVNNEGTKMGFDVKYASKILKISNKPIIFEGGFGSLSDIEKAFDNGISSIALGSMITFSDNNIFKIKQYLENKGYNIRLRN